MTVHLLYFSPTGGTQKVVELLASPWEGARDVVDLSDPDVEGRAFGPDDVCIVGAPSFAGRVPGPALERLGRMTARGSKTLIAAAYGNRDFDDTLLELRDALAQRGFLVAAAAAAVTEHSILRSYGAGRPDEEDRRALEAFARGVRSAFEAGTPPQVQVPGSRPYRESAPLPMRPAAGRDCTGCGTCAKLCPVRAIPQKDPSKTNRERCITCMRCVAVCPAHARAIPAPLLLAANIKLKKACSGRKSNHFYPAAL